MSNCKQIATGLSMYRDDNQGCLMIRYHQDHPGTQGYDPVYRHAFWMRALMPYVRSKRVYTCPASTIKFGNWIGAQPCEPDWPAANYGINECLVEWRWSELSGVPALNRDSAIFLPTKTALVADCNSVVFWGGDGLGTQGTSTGPDGNVYPDGMVPHAVPQYHRRRQQRLCCRQNPPRWLDHDRLHRSARQSVGHQSDTNPERQYGQRQDVSDPSGPKPSRSSSRLILHSPFSIPHSHLTGPAC